MENQKKIHSMSKGYKKNEDSVLKVFSALKSS